MKLKFSGCEIELSLLFSSLICVLLLTDKTGLMCLSLISAAIHETGHLIAMLIFKIKPDKIKFCAYGIIISKNTNKLSHTAQLAVFSGGCIMNFLLSAFLAFGYNTTNFRPFAYFAVSNLLTGTFSSLPICGLDGYDILNLSLSMHLGITKAEKISRIVSMLFCTMPMLLTIFLIINGEFNINLLIMSVYLVIILIVKLL